MPRKKNQKLVESKAPRGVDLQRQERRKRAYSLRAQGLSYPSIAQELGISLDTAWHDVQWASQHWGDVEENKRESIRGQLLEVLREATGILMNDIQRQAVEGQQVVATDGQGREVGTQTKRTVDPRSVAELGRTCERVGKLMGLLESGIDAGNGGAAAIQVVLPGAMDGNAFTAAAASGELTAGVVDTQALPEAPSEGS